MPSQYSSSYSSQYTRLERDSTRMVEADVIMQNVAIIGLIKMRVIRGGIVNSMPQQQQNTRRLLPLR
jgi:hypothetical protein